MKYELKFLQFSILSDHFPSRFPQCSEEFRQIVTSIFNIIFDFTFIFRRPHLRLTESPQIHEEERELEKEASFLPHVEENQATTAFYSTAFPRAQCSVIKRPKGHEHEFR